MKNTINKVCKDKNDNWAIAQTPNLPILVWFICIILNWFIKDHELSETIGAIGTIFLAIWAYLEIFYGDSLFRRILGSIVMSYILISIVF